MGLPVVHWIHLKNSIGSLVIGVEPLKASGMQPISGNLGVGRHVKIA